MILINLLPHREEKRKRRRTAYFAGLGVAAVAGLLAVGVWFAVLESMKASQEERNAYLGSEIKKLETQIKDIANLRAEIDALKARQKAVEDLQADRNVPVHLLNELVKQTPEGVYLTSIKQAGQVVTVIGVAQTNERVSEFLRNTLYSSPWLERPELIEIKAAVAAQGRSSRLFDFSMRVSIKRPQAPADAASAPAAKTAAAGAKAS
ncbi:MAG: PilN domain-containing protein [Aquincola sp.]|nr:PilN domain-containing protein [Aquincola sp.]MDH4289170.1 PilN domain-containing protein [Aquincola sp.]MDH5331945.1 PilN domain-containing protein [Aquincola sp.]